MKSQVMWSSWKFQEQPIPAIGIGLSFGRNQNATGTIPVRGVLVGAEFGLVFYETGGREIRQTFASEAELEGKVSALEAEGYRYSLTRLPGKFALPDHAFRVAVSAAGPSIVAGEDTTDRVLLFCGTREGFRGGCCLVEEATTAKVLLIRSAGNRCEGEICVCALVASGEQVVLHDWGRRNDDYTSFRNQAGVVTRQEYTAEGWAHHNAPEGEII